MLVRRNFLDRLPAGWPREFGPNYRPPVWVLSLVNHGILEDRSWHNDIAASFVLPGRSQDMYIWVDHEDPEERDSAVWTPGMDFVSAGPRYGLTLGSHEHSEHEPLWAGDDEDELRDVFFSKRLELGF